MDRSTQRALNAINLEFYRRDAASFSRTRHAPWRGWLPIVDELARRGPDRPAVLDVGCGNGRFGALLARRLGRPFSYAGIDASAPLLALADERLADLPGRRLIRHDLLDLAGDPLPSALGAARFDLIALFGLMHHLPGEALRQRLVATLARRLTPRGVLALSIWRFAAEPRFATRIVPWAESDALLDEAALEPGDLLLAWGPRGDRARRPYRYCHAIDTAGERRLVAAAGRPLIARWDADGANGAMNRYLLFAATP